jgi:hypothetical protein
MKTLPFEWSMLHQLVHLLLLSNIMGLAFPRSMILVPSNLAATLESCETFTAWRESEPAVLLLVSIEINSGLPIIPLPRYTTGVSGRRRGGRADW